MKTIIFEMAKCLLSILTIRTALVESSNNMINTGLEDDLQFSFKWPGSLFEEEMKQNIEFIDMSTNYNEKYKCAIPATLPTSEENKYASDLNGEKLISASSLLENIYSKKFCSYRIESYWIYELCHGSYVKQYHETKTSGKRMVTNEYFLGYYDADKQEPDYFKQSENQMIPNVSWRTLGGEKIAMFGVKYTDGTLCEVLTDTNREITVFYACDENGNDNIASFEEISSCIYEMIVVTKWICAHPAYKIPEKTQQSISCFSIDDSPMRPHALVDLELEQNTQKLEENKIKMTNRQGETIIVHYKTIDDDHDQDTDDETLNPRDLNFQFIQPEQPIQQQHQQQPQAPMPMPSENNNQQYQHTIGGDAQKEMINAFLRGSECLTGGGAGWWKYEICMHRHVIQFHQDEKTKKRNVILLGEWNIENHVEWLNKNPVKRPFKDKNLRQFVSHFYTNGDFCELTNKKRVVEVKFKCLVTKEKTHAISLYLVEHSTCEYLLAIESPWLCDFVNSVDDVNGIPELGNAPSNQNEFPNDP